MSASEDQERKGQSPLPSRQNDGLSNEQKVHFAWHAHEAVQGSIESVDIKASIVLVAEIAVVGAAANALLTDGGELHNATGIHLALATASLVALAGAVAVALWVVFPRLGSRKHRAGSNEDIIYFGHLRLRSPEHIAGSLEALTPDNQLRQLSRQLHVIGQVAWRKHVWLRWSIGLLALGSVLMVITLVAFDPAEGPSSELPVKVKILK
jgi:hypothetical protein